MRPLNHLILLSEPEPTGPEPFGQDGRLLAFASWMGIPAKAVPLRNSQQGSALPDGLLNEFEAGSCALAISAETLADHASIADELQRFLRQCASALLVFGCTNAERHLRAIARLTGGMISGSEFPGADSVSFSFPQSAVSFSQQLAGLGYLGRYEEPIFAFEAQDAAAADVIMAANEAAVFLRMDRGSSPLFLLSMPLPDLDQTLDAELELQEHYHRLIPLLIFLRQCFGASCWHGPESTARLIIDDPLLTEQYGFLEHSVLMKSMEHSGYGTSIAFIPWNYWRTSRQNAGLLGEQSNFAICVHGCDHTNKEFAIRDSALVDRKAGLALRRMELQRQRTGAAFEPVMVFPQGLFSRAAIAALRAHDYLAAVNTSVFPTDGAPEGLIVADLLQPAVTKYDGFPIFQRRYPRRLFDFAFDLFLGRPALVVEHHEYFREGVETWQDFVAEMHKLDPTLTWPGLADQLMRSCRRRNASNGSIEIQFYTRKFFWSNREPDTRNFSLCKQEPNAASIESVSVDGESSEFSFENGFLKLEVQAGPGETHGIEIVDREHPQERANGFGLAHNARVMLRRGLSEFRDNTLSRHDGLLKIAKGIVRGLKVTGDA